jgi:hypothetical protein
MGELKVENENIHGMGKMKLPAPALAEAPALRKASGGGASG